MNFFKIIIGIAILCGIIELFLKLKDYFSTNKEAEIKLPYKKKDYLLTIAERNFYEVLSQVAQSHNALLFAKVRLEDLLLTYGSYYERQKYRSKIKSRHVDFLLCDKENIRPLLAIELDDSSHNRENRIDRDDFINKALHDAGLPILHVKVKSFYDPQELSEQVASLLK